MICPQCGSANVTVQMVTDTQLVAQKHSLLWWLLVGWWWLIVKWFFFTWLALLAKIFAPKKKTIKTEHRSICVCQNCGYSGDADEFQRESVIPSAPVAPVAAQRIVSARCDVAGESYHRDAIASLGEITHEYYTPCGLLYQRYVDGDIIYKYRFDRMSADLMPEPDNAHDPNSIRVDVSGVTVGYIPRKDTGRVHDLLNEGATCVASIAGGPRKLISEDELGDLTAAPVDYDFSVRLEFFIAERKPAPAPAPVSPTVPSREPSRPAEIAMWIALAASIVCAIGVFAVGAFDMLPSTYLLGCVIGAVASGMLAWILAGRAFA